MQLGMVSFRFLKHPPRAFSELHGRNEKHLRKFGVENAVREERRKTVSAASRSIV